MVRLCLVGPNQRKDKVKAQTSWRVDKIHCMGGWIGIVNVSVIALVGRGKSEGCQSCIGVFLLVDRQPFRKRFRVGSGRILLDPVLIIVPWNLTVSRVLSFTLRLLAVTEAVALRALH